MNRKRIRLFLITFVTVAAVGIVFFQLLFHTTHSASESFISNNNYSDDSASHVSSESPQFQTSLSPDIPHTETSTTATLAQANKTTTTVAIASGISPKTELSESISNSSPGFGASLAKWLTRGPGANRLTGRVVVECAAAEFDPIYVDQVTLIVMPDTLRSWFMKSQPADSQRFDASLQSDGSFAIYSNLKGSATLMVEYNKHLNQTSNFRVPIFSKQFQINTKKKDQDLGDIVVSCGGGVIVNTVYPEGVKPPEWGMSLALFDFDSEECVQSEPIVAAPGGEFVPHLPLGKFKARIFSDRLRFEPEMVDVEISDGGQTPVLLFLATPTSCIRGVAILTSETDKQFHENLPPDRVVLTGPDGLSRELTPTDHDTYNLLGKDALKDESFVFFNLPEGEYHVSVEVEGYDPVSLETQLQSGQMQFRGFAFKKND